MQGHDRLVVGGGGVNEVDYQSGLLAGGAAGDAADSLLVDPPGGRRRQMHADRRPRRVPPLGQEHRIAQHIDLATLEGSKDLGQLALRRFSRNRARHDTGVLKGLGDILCVLHSSGVKDAGNFSKARLVEVCDRKVEGLLVQQRGELLLIEVLINLAFSQRYLGDRPHPRTRRNTEATQRRNHAPASCLSEVKARGLSREEVGDVAGDQRPGRRHPNVDGAGPGADAGTGLLTQARYVPHRR